MLLVLGFSFCFTQAQDRYGFYLTIADTSYYPVVTPSGDYVLVTFEDNLLTEVVSNYSIYHFEQAFLASRFPDMHKIWYIESNAQELMSILEDFNPNVFFNGEVKRNGVLLYTLNDYGLATSG